MIQEWVFGINALKQFCCDKREERAFVTARLIAMFVDFHLAPEKAVDIKAIG